MLDSPPAKPTVSVIIVTANGLPYLDRCLAAVMREVDDRDTVIVVDNGSTDGGPQFIRKAYPRVRLVANRENCGFARACNQGAALATGCILVFLNQDTEVQAGWLGGLIAPLQEGNDVGLTTSCLLLMSAPDRIDLCGQDVHYTGLVFGRGHGKPAARAGGPCDVDAVSGASFAIGRELWDQLQRLDQGFFMYYEETDLSWRAQLAGFRCRYVPESRAFHDYRRHHSDLRLYYSFRNREIMLLKNWSLPTLALLAPALLIAELLELGLALSHGWRGARAKALSLGWIALHLRQIRRMRAAARTQRTLPDAHLLSSLTAEVRPTIELGPTAHVLVALANGVFRANRWAAVRLLERRRPGGSRQDALP